MKVRAYLALAILVFATSAVCGQDRSSWLHSFRLWGKVNEHEKMVLLWGITNGFWIGASGGDRTSGGFLTSGCQDKITVEQAIAMVDKHYRNTPEQWDTPLGIAVIKALTVKGGACEKYSQNPWSSPAEEKVTNSPQNSPND
jgi:hypothetical protein